MPQKIEMVVFDMAGTTIKDENEVENCFWEAVNQTGLVTTHEQINSMMGWSKRTVFETLWNKQLPSASAREIDQKVDHSFNIFRNILEHHYQTTEVLPTSGCIEVLNLLRKRQIKIALTTGFYRKVTDIILGRLGWNKGLNEDHIGNGLINISVSSDEVKSGRPAPFMIFRAMEMSCVNDVRKIIKIGDTPSDLAEGKNAGCLFSMGVTNGTHTKEQLDQYEHDGLFGDLIEFRSFLEKNI
jgi:phosphonatase-like hydrolase